MSSRVQRVLAELPHLTRDELEQVRSHIGLLRNLGPSEVDTTRTAESKNDGDRQADLTLSAIAQAMRDAGVEYIAPHALRRGSNFPAFRDKMPALFQYLTLVGSEQVQQLALLRVGIQLLYDNLTAMNIAVSGRTIMQHIHRIPAVINQAYPGYASGGLLKLVVGRKKVHNVRS